MSPGLPLYASKLSLWSAGVIYGVKGRAAQDKTITMPATRELVIAYNRARIVNADGVGCGSTRVTEVVMGPTAQGNAINHAARVLIRSDNRTRIINAKGREIQGV